MMSFKHLHASVAEFNPYADMTSTQQVLKAITESIIRRQNGEFFSGLVALITKLRETATGLVGNSFYKSKEVKALTEYVEGDKGLGLSITLSAGDPAIYLPMVDLNHPFFDDLSRQLIGDYGYRDISALMLALKKPMLQGEVDFVNARVSGCFSRLPLRMMMPRDMLMSDKYKPEECASVMCHEFGHAFTTLSMVGQTLRTSIWLRQSIKVQESNEDPKTKQAFFIQMADELKLTAKEKELIESAKSPMAKAVIIVGQGARPQQDSTTQASYDYTTCESMADQFAMRLGAGAHLATALDKIYTSYGQKPGTAAYIVLNVLGFLNAVLFTVGTWGIGVILAVAFSNRDNIYDSPKARIARMRQDLIIQLRNGEVPKEELDEVLKQTDSLQELMNDYPDLGLPWYEMIAQYVNPRYSRALAAELLQKDLEKLSNSDLALWSLKLKNNTDKTV